MGISLPTSSIIPILSSLPPSRFLLSTKPQHRAATITAIRVAASTAVQPRCRPPRVNPQATTTAPSFSSKLHGRRDHHLHLLRHEHIHGCQPENAIATIPSRVQPSPSSSSRTHLQRGKLRQIQKQNPRHEFHLPHFSIVAPATAFQPSSITIIGPATLRQKPLIAPPSPECATISLVPSSSTCNQRNQLAQI
ncbi:hypothetical protein V8G54_011672 [Vigna mungo]|uniref:Uncharacterized protein n=1 Tax=Vigna mungo TaxID=3915 RepID=A0AAQ3NSE0_VIGMU